MKKVAIALGALVALALVAWWLLQPTRPGPSAATIVVVPEKPFSPTAELEPSATPAATAATPSVQPVATPPVPAPAQVESPDAPRLAGTRARDGSGRVAPVDLQPSVGATMPRPEPADPRPFAADLPSDARAQ